MELKNTTVAVTGATGFLGRYIVDALLRRGARVISVVRSPEKASDQRERGVELRRADLTDRSSLARGFEGVDAIVSNAALVSLGSSRPEELFRTNLDGTRNVIDAAREAGVRRIVKISSTAVYERKNGVSLDEDHPKMLAPRRVTRLNAYGVSKARAEALAWDLAAEHGIALTTLRPNAIYGANDRTSFTYVFRKLMAFKVAPYPGSLRVSLVYAGDVAEAAALALERPESAGRDYNVCGDDLDCWEFLRAWKAAGGRAPSVVIPVRVPLYQIIDSARIRAELDWRPRPYEEGCREVIATEGP